MNLMRAPTYIELVATECFGIIGRWQVVVRLKKLDFLFVWFVLLSRHLSVIEFINDN